MAATIAEPRLAAAVDVDDRQPPVAEPGPVDVHLALVVGAAMHEPAEHALGLARDVRAVDGRDAAHQRATPQAPAAPAAAPRARQCSPRGGRSGRGGAAEWPPRRAPPDRLALQPPGRAADPPVGGSGSHPWGELLGAGAAARHAGRVLEMRDNAVFFPDACISELTRLTRPASPCASPAGRERVADLAG